MEIRKSNMKTLTIIRHGKSEMNEINSEKYSVFSGQTECSLSFEGKIEARKLRKELSKVGYDIAYISSSIRAIETYKEIGLNIEKVQFLEELKERSLGILEGMSVQNFLSNKNFKDFWPSGEKGDFKHSFSNKAPNGESYTDVCNRLVPLVNRIKNSDEENILIISHYVAIRCLLLLLGYLDQSNIFEFRIGNCEVIKINI